MKIIESYTPVFQKWGDNGLSIYYEYNAYGASYETLKIQIANGDKTFDGYFLYYGYKVAYALHTLYSDRDGLDLRELMTTYKTGRSV